MEKTNKYLFLRLGVIILAVAALLLTASCGSIDASKGEDTTPKIDESTDVTTYPDSVVDTTAAPDTTLPVEDIAKVTLNGHSLAEYSIVASKVSQRNVPVDELQAKLSELCGAEIPIVEPTEFEIGKPAIYLGTSTTGSDHIDDAVRDGYTYFIEGKDGAVAIDYAYQRAGKLAVERFIAEFLNVSPDADGRLSITVPNEKLSGFFAGDELNGLVLVSDKTETLADGVTYHEMLYRDSDNKPVRVYAVKVEAGKASFYTGTPDDGTTLLNKNSTVTNEMKAAVANGKNVIVGTNADFFDMGGTSLPRGLCVKDGEVLRNNTARPFFAVLDDGTAVVCHSNEYSKYSSRIINAVGGQYVLLKDGLIIDMGLGKEFAYTRHPRTAVGIRDNGDVILLVVDGRQPSISNGASLADLTQIFRELGCVHALNLDGGGSSTFVIRDAASDTYSVKNSPSDGSQRKIQNSLLIVLEDKND